MSSSSGAEGTPITSPHEHQSNAPVAKTMDAKLMLATGSGDVQQLKDLVNKQEEDSKMMVVVMAKQQAAASAEKPHQRNMDPLLLALASSGSAKKLQTLLSGEDGQASGHGGTSESLSTRRARSYAADDTEANESILEGVTAEGDTALHVVAASGQGDNFCTKYREAKPLLQQNDKWRWWLRCWCLTSGQRHALLTTYGYGDGDNFLQSACIIYEKVKHLLFVQNNNGDTPLHCAARAGKSNMVKCLVDLALAEGGEDKMKELLWKENKHKETALHEAVRVGNKDIVDLLMDKDSELANFPQDGGASPMYVAIMLKQDEIVKTLYEKSHGKLSFSGPNGQNALHAAVLRYPHRYRHQDLTKLLDWNKTLQNKDLTIQKDGNGSTPLVFAAAIKFTHQFKPSSICRQVLEANPDALYQPDHAGFFPIHVAASVGASWNVDMFVKRYPGSAGLRDAKGRTFLHVAIEKKKVNVIKSACRNLSLSWIMNMVDNNGNTALHLAVESGSLQMFCPLLGNPQVNLNLPNNRGETPLDVAQYKLSKLGLHYSENSEEQICGALVTVGAVNGVCRKDDLKDNKTVTVKHDETKKMKELKDSAGTFCIGSVLIATVTFGATFAVPGGYIDDDHSNLGSPGSPVLARRYRYVFDAFIASNTLAFVSSTMATIGLMNSGSPVFNTRSRIMHLNSAFKLVSLSITFLTAAFALGAYVVLDPVSHKTAVATCVASYLVLLYKSVEITWRRLLLLPPLFTRKGGIWVLLSSVFQIMVYILSENWPLVIIFLWVVLTSPGSKLK